MRLFFALLLFGALLALTLQPAAAHFPGSYPGQPATYSPHWHALSTCPPKPGWAASAQYCVYPWVYWCEPWGSSSAKVHYWVHWYGPPGSGKIGMSSAWGYSWTGCYYFT